MIDCMGAVPTSLLGRRVAAYHSLITMLLMPGLPSCVSSARQRRIAGRSSVSVHSPDQECTPRRGAGRAGARRAGRGLRRHRHQPALRAQGVLHAAARRRADARERARRPVAGVLVADRGRRRSSTSLSSCGPTTEGEGGILALLALVRPQSTARAARGRCWSALGLFGAALLYGDGVITPAISVLGAVEGLERRHAGARAAWSCRITVRHPARRCSCAAARHRRASAASSARSWLVWFSCHRAAGLAGSRHPRCSRAVNPIHARRASSRSNGVPGFLVLGSVVLVHHRRRGAVRRHGPLRSAPDPAHLVHGRLPGAAAQLLRPGRAAARTTRRRPAQSVLRAGAARALYPMVVLATRRRSSRPRR